MLEMDLFFKYTRYSTLRYNTGHLEKDFNKCSSYNFIDNFKEIKKNKILCYIYKDGCKYGIFRYRFRK